MKKDTKQTELIWLWMNTRENYYALSAIIDHAIETGVKPAALGQEIMKHFYAQIPYVGKRTFWLDILDQCMEHVEWTEIAKRVLIEVGSRA